MAQTEDCVCTVLCKVFLLIVNLAINVPSHCELAVVFILCVGLKFIWERRKEGKLATPLEMKGELLARIAVLKRSRFHSEARQAEDAMLYFV